jgi:hypothetical protein
MTTARRRASGPTPAAGELAVALLLGGVLAAAWPGDARCAAPGPPGEARTVALTAAAARSGYELPDALVLAGTDSLMAGATPLVAGLDYVLDAGALRLVSDIPDTTRLVLRYRFLRLGLRPVYRRARPDTAGAFPALFPGGAPLVADAAASRQEPPGAALRVGGAKTFGITVGSDRDLSLEQSLRLSVSGNVTDAVAVNAYLTDQNTPLVPEGDTEELRALDRVLVEIESERAWATMGDIRFAMEGGTLASVRRELSGVAASARVGPATVLVAGARLEGEFASALFRGVDGKQGPYLLSGAGGAAGAVIVAGSERVWVDGRAMTRGADRDYVIDYAAGEIRFTERRPVSSDSEITVDYEYALAEYPRDIYGARGSTPLLDGAAEVGVTLIREADDRSSPEGTPLTDEDAAALEAAGDDPSLARDDGVSFVGAGEGDYVEASPGVFEYAGADSGDYDLVFERFDGGDYDYDYPSGSYVYAGPGEGRYRLGRTLPMPTELGLLAGDARLSLPGGGSVGLEGAVSSKDENTFSSLDDDDNLGNAQVLDASLPVLAFGEERGSTLSVGVSGRRVGGCFEGVARFRELRYEEKWELEGLDLPSAESLLEGRAALALEGGGRASASFGRLERGDALSSSKAEFDAAFSPAAGTRAWANGRFVEMERAGGDSAVTRERTLYRGGVERAFGPVVPSLSYAHDERATGADGARYDEVGGAVALPDGPLTLRASYSRRLSDASDGGGWERVSTTTTQECSLGLSGSERLTVDATVLRRATDAEESTGQPDARYDLASVRLGHRSFDGALSGEVRYAVTATEVEEKERYVTVEDGVEVTRIVSTGRFLPVTDVSAGTRWTASPRSARGALPDPSALGRFLSGLSFETDVRVREMSTTDDRWGLYLFSPEVIQGPETVTGEITARHVARYAARGGLSVRLSVDSRDALDRSFTNASDRRKERSGAAEVRVAPGRRVSYRVRAELAARDQRTAGAGSSYDIGEGTALAEVTSSPSPELEVRLTGSVTRQDERLDGVEVTVASVTPGASYRLAERGAVTLSFTRAEVVTDAETLPTHLAGGRQPGVTSEWRMSGDYRVNRYLTGSLSLTGESRPGSDVRHTLDVRVNAYF